MKTPILRNGVYLVSKTLKIKADVYSKFEKEVMRKGLTPSSLLNEVLTDRYK